MIIALVSLVLSSLIVIPSITLAATSTRAVSLKGTSLRASYGADAGIEEVLWALKYAQPIPTAVPGTLNGAQVTMDTVNQGAFTLIAGEWESTNSHSTDLSITTTMVWDEGHNAYKYTVNATYSGTGQCKLIEIGARLPIGYDYEPGSAALFPGNLSTANPDNELDGEGAHRLEWDFSQTTINPTGIQTFYVTGSGPLEHDYGWAEATREDVGEVGELTGTFYIITATARKGGTITGQIQANAMVSGSAVSVTSWRVLK